MIFAELTKRPNSKDVKKILDILEANFGQLQRHQEWGDQGTDGDPDAYFWIERKGFPRVAVDNFTSFEFQVKCAKAGNPLTQEVIAALSKSFDIKVFDEPEFEDHE